jgi:hypothetical protein
MAKAIAYLLLVTFSTPGLRDLQAPQLEAIAESPYHGVASPLLSAYDVDPVPEPAAFSAVDDFVGQHLPGKQVWPWVFLNRLIGQAPGTEGHAHAGAPPHEYFTSIKGMDLWDETGALSDWMAIWRLALQLSDDLEAPGIVVDLEAYNDYRAYDPVYLAERSGRPVEEVIARLKEIGVQMAEVIAEEREHCLVWTLFSGLDRPRYGPENETYYRSVAYLLMGMMDAAQENDLRLTVIDGGSVGIGYYNESLDRLQAKIAARAEQLAPLLAERGPLFRLGGTIAPWHDPALLTGWAARVAGDNPPFNSIHDFAPLVEELLRSYDFVWIYAASAVGYDPYDPDIAAPYNEMLARALEAAQR